MTAGVGRRHFLTGMAAGALLAGCAPPSDSVNEAVPPLPRPPYYPADYDRIVDASKAERRLVIYSNMDAFNWRPVIDGFRTHYPWVEDILTTNLGSSQVFQRHNAEDAAGRPQASFLVSGSPQNWLDFANAGQALDYVSPELGQLPGFARTRPGLYTFSSDAIIMTYNKVLLRPEERPRGLADLITLVRSNPDRFRHRITTYSAGISFGLAIQYSYFLARNRNWSAFDALLPYTRAENSSGPMLDKISSGEYLIGYFASGPVILPQMTQYNKVVGWNLISDATPLFLRGMAIPAKSPHPNTGKLMLDYILSAEGQANIAGGGFTPYRSGVHAPAGRPTYDSVVSDVGKDNVVLIGYDLGPEAEQDRFAKDWEARLG
ncbi:ABC transporter substrate-binding protein [Pseudonocardia acaciae]|uniref:ABC transporter substrate-binding protein n=1 Tax=Pseudonocardia acaciae TaxID=551276 RepID=UPI000684AF28|nr:hypothetical protein [Pseudonocardia acaciae]